MAKQTDKPPIDQGSQETSADENIIYVVTDALDHNGTRYNVGDEIDLIELQACVLLAQGVITVKAEPL